MHRADAAFPVPAAAETREVASVRNDATLSGTRSQAAAPKPKTGLWIGIAAALLLAAGAGYYFLMGAKAADTAIGP